MKIYYSDTFEVPLPADHRFPMIKYRLLREAVLADHLIPQENIIIAPEATRSQLALVHTKSYIDKVLSGKLTEKEVRRIGFPWSPQLVVRSRHSVGGTIAACFTAYEEGISLNLAGGTHHAFPNYGQGYCIFNDVAIATRCIQNEKQIHNILIIDCDVHQGNGTALTFQDDPNVFTYSIHAKKNFPVHKRKSNLDIELEDNIGDQDYLNRLSKSIQIAIELAKPEFAIFLAGADPYSGDRLGRLSISKKGLKERDKLIMSKCYQKGIPLSIVMSGGYASNINDTVQIHLNTVRIAAHFAILYTNKGISPWMKTNRLN